MAATFAVGAVASTVSQKLERMIAPKLESELNTAYFDKWWYSTTRDMEKVDEAIEKAKTAAARQAQLVAKAVGDGYKDVVKKTVQTEVKKLLDGGRKPVNAFFQAQKKTLVRLAKDKIWTAEDGRPLIWELHHLNPHLPYAVAAALAKAAGEAIDNAQQEQEQRTIGESLAYTAKAHQEKWDGKKYPDGKGATDLSSELYWEGQAPGVLHVMAHVDDVTPNAVQMPDPDEAKDSTPPGRPAVDGKKYAAFPELGSMFGLTDGMIGMLSGPIFNLPIPVVYSISSHDDLDGVGRERGGLDFRQAKMSFSIGVNEHGATFLGSRTTIQDKAVQRCGGVDAIIRQLGIVTLKDLYVTADHG